MLLRCLRSSFTARRFSSSSSFVEPLISSTVATEVEKWTKAEVSTQNTTNSNRPASRALGTLPSRLLRLPKFDSAGAASVLSKWMEEGRVVCRSQITYTVRQLMIRNDYAKALMICDFMLEVKTFMLNPVGYALHLDLISRVRGSQSAEKYFDCIPEKMKGEITSTALLIILVKNRETVKAEALMEKMKKTLFLSNPEPYIHMMSLYFSKEQFEKAEEMSNEVKKYIPSDVRMYNMRSCVRIYNMWLSAFASGKDVEGAERVFAQMKEAKVVPNWLTHATLGGLYIKTDLFEKAGAALKDMEDLALPVAPCSAHFYCSLIRMHGSIGNKDEVMRIWDKLKSKSEMSNSEYDAMVWSLLKLDLPEKAEEVFNEWESFPKSRAAYRSSPVFRSMFMRKHGKDGENAS